ncbi:MAG: ester cyclase [Dokdonella sp.]
MAARAKKKKKVAAKKVVLKAKAKAKQKPKRKAAPAAKARPDSLAREKARLEKNKKLVLEFYRKMIGDKDPEAARAHMGPVYKQHSPYAKDGFEGVAEFATMFKRDCPNHRYEVKRVIAEGDYVVLHLHGINGLGPHGEAVIDVFRVKGDKVIEHWDVIQSLPEKYENANGPF